jgi:hypothetical protein
MVHTRVLVALTVFALVPAFAGAVIVPGGGSSATDCLLVFDAQPNSPENKPRNFRCADGAACDGDGIVNGVCEFSISICANSTYNPSCTVNELNLVTVEHAADNGDPKFDPEYQALQSNIENDIEYPTEDLDKCTDATLIHVPVKGPFAGNSCKGNKKKMKITSLSQVIGGKIYKDTDRMMFTCDPSPLGCDPQVFWASTFERVQKQIFNQSCALSSCHDSQSQAGSLLLETGASRTNLIDVVPENVAAAGAGWERINQTSPTTGDPATSFIVHKIEGDFPAGGDYGDRMPLHRPKLPQNLIDVITNWVAAGAPDETAGWIPGTF